MRKGTILYVSGDSQLDLDATIQAQATALDVNPRLWVQAGEENVHAALRFLIQRGATLVEGVCVESSSDGGLRRVGHAMRLYG